MHFNQKFPIQTPGSEIFDQLLPITVLFFSTKKPTVYKTVVFRWERKFSPFQNTKNYWNPLIIREEIFILVLESINSTWSRVFEVCRCGGADQIGSTVRDANTGFSTVFMCMGGTIARLLRLSCKFQIVWTIPILDNLFWLHFQFWLFRCEKSENV